jgi:cobalt/nickel transport system ATP-binding protein
MDEPTSFLDPCSRRLLIKTLSDLPHTELIATHDLDMVRDVCERVIVLKNGTLLANDATENILSDKYLLEECGL